MGKKELRVAPVPKWVTFALLLLTALLMAALLWSLSGKAYSKDQAVLPELAALMQRFEANRASNASVVAAIMPLFADALFFLPLGFFTFLLFDRPARSPLRVYLIVIVIGLAYSAALAMWQYSLPTQVTGVGDTLWNACGAIAGAVVAHLRKRIEIRFE